nr:reverse transcriptase domain-containing protein [Tanacetum cinerariifolium]
MFGQFVKMNTASSLGSGSLRSNTTPNPQEDLKAITTQSGVTLAGPSVSPPPPSKVVDREPETVTDHVLTESTNNVPPLVVQPSLASTSSTPISSSKMPEVTKDTVQPSTENIQPLVAQTQVPIDEPVVAPKPKPTIPYPSKVTKQKLREKDDNLALKFVEIFRNLHFELSFADALLHMPKFSLMFKSLLNNKEKLFDLATTLMNENFSAVILKKLPKKLGDHEKFLIPCDFPELDECLALTDLGASINLMPLSIWRKLSFPELTSTQMILELADRSTTRPAGIAKDVFVKVGKFHFPTDFVVVDYVVDPRVPLILRRPFMRTRRALIDVYGEELTLRVDVEEITFKGIDPRFCTHKILMEDDFKPAVQHQRRVNPKIHKVIKKEVIKLLDAGLIYSTFDSPWVSPVHCVPKKDGMTVVKNKDNELIPTRCMMAIFHDMIKKTMEVFMDNFSVFDDSFSSCLSHLDKILQRAKVDVIAKLPHPNSVKDANPRLLRWILLLQEFDVIIRDKKGAENLAADHLSRLENPHQDELEKKEITETFPLETLGMIAFRGENRTSWFGKLDDALWALRTTFKTPIGCTLYKLVYEKACHFPIELEHKAYWALKHCNFDLKTAGDHRKVHLNELNELRDQDYENSLIYKEETNKIHDSKIKNRFFNVGDRVLLFNSCLKIFSRKLKTRWTGSFTVAHVFLYGTIELSQANGPNFKVNGHRLKHYFGGDIPKLVVLDL